MKGGPLYRNAHVVIAIKLKAQQFFDRQFDGLPQAHKLPAKFWVGGPTFSGIGQFNPTALAFKVPVDMFLEKLILWRMINYGRLYNIDLVFWFNS